MRSLLVLGFLAACSAVEPTASTGYRDPAALVASKADFDADRFAGRWYEIARFPDPVLAGCAGVVTDWTRTPAGYDLTRACLGTNRPATARGTALIAPFGRMTLALDGTEVPTWVLWTDTGYRTAILARPDGRGASILNRDPDLPGDRLRAALEVLDFNGFDTDALVFDGSR